MYSNNKNRQLFKELRKTDIGSYVISNNKYLHSGQFDSCRQIKGLMLTGNSECIKANGFSDCENLHLIIFNDNLKRIETEAFSGNKCKSLFIPNLVDYIGDNALSSETLEYIKLPDRLMYAISCNHWPLIDTYHLKEDNIICSASNPGFDFYIHSKRTKIYLRREKVDLNRILSNLSIEETSECHLTIGKEVKEIKLNAPMVFNTIYLDPHNSNFVFNSGFVTDSSGCIILMKKKTFKKIISIESRISPHSFLPAIESYGGGRYTKFDTRHNPGFKETFGVILNKDKCVVYIPDEKEVFVAESSGMFAPNILLNHIDLEHLIICAYDNELCSSRYSLDEAVNRFFSYENKFRRHKPLKITIPQKEFITNPNSLNSTDLIIEIKKIESPDVVIE